MTKPKQAWAVFHKRYRITKTPMTEYDAKNARIHWSKYFNHLEIREVWG